MLVVPGYELTVCIRESPRALVYRATRARDGLRVVIKAPSDEFPSSIALARLRAEYRMYRRFDDPRIVRAHELVTCSYGLALVLEDFGADNLRALVGPEKEPVTRRRWLWIARELAAALAVVHGAGVIHRDVKPDNIVYSEAAGRVALIDFSVATALQSAPEPSTELIGTPRYIAPEQTGRMGRPVDQRSDLYSLGATLYELQSGEPPFVGDDPAELLHAHIARRPEPLARAREDTPPMIAAIVHKLLAKEARARYQTAAGLLVDLERLLDAAAAGRGDAREPFALGEHDAVARVQLPARLFGRDAVLQAMKSQLARVFGGEAELVLVAGPEGIGKTALINELRRPVAKLRGLYCAGKFDQVQRDSPYASLLQALDGLVGQLLSLPGDSLTRWRDAMGAALGSNAEFIAASLPALARLLEIELDAARRRRDERVRVGELDRRFEAALLQLLGALARPEHPLVIFLDDLQWSDSATLAMLVTILTTGALRHVLWIGAFRPAEVAEDGPLMRALRTIREHKIAVERHELGPLAVAAFRELVRATFGDDMRGGDALADALARLSEGNPYFARALLRALVEQDAIRREDGRWRWDPARAAGLMEVPDGVASLLAKRLDSLPAATRRALDVAACVGDRFTLRLVRAIRGGALAELVDALTPAVTRGLIRPLDDRVRHVPGAEDLVASRDGAGGFDVRYRFTHDRVRELVYARLTEASRARLHARIGRQLIADGAGRSDASLFTVVDHMGRAAALIADDEERVVVARLHLRAGESATRSMAYGVADELLARGVALLPEDAWTEHHALSLELQRARWVARLLAGAPNEALTALAELSARVDDRLERARLDRLRVRFYLHNVQDMDAGLTLARECLRSLGVSINMSPGPFAIARAVAKLAWLVKSGAIEGLRERPELEGEEDLICLELLARVLLVTTQRAPRVVPVLIVQMVERGLDRGVSPALLEALAMLGSQIATRLDDPATAERVGALAVTLARGLRDPPGPFVLGPLWLFVFPWTRPYAEVLAHLERLSETLLARGQRQVAALVDNGGLSLRFVSGDGLGELLASARASLAAYGASAGLKATYEARTVWLTCAALRGLTDSLTTLSRGEWLEEHLLTLARSGDVIESYNYWLHKGVLLFHARRLEDAAAAFAESRAALPPLAKAWNRHTLACYEALTLAMLAQESGMRARVSSAPALRDARATVRRLARLCPENAAVPDALLDALSASRRGRPRLALAAFDRAVERARALGNAHWEGVATELAARFALAEGRALIGAAYLAAAHQAYLRWGATAKVARLREEFGIVAARPSSARGEPVDSTSAGGETRAPTSRGGSRDLDLESVLEVSRAITGELVLEQLLEATIRTLLVSAGARRCVLVMPDESGALRVEAEGSVEPDMVRALASAKLEDYGRAPATLIRYVARARERVVTEGDAPLERFEHDPYLLIRAPRSLLCVPLEHRGQLAGVVYLEHGLVEGVFTQRRVELLRQLALQIAVAIENARLYRELDQARARAVTADRVKSQFLRNMSHELRTPLNAIIGYAQLLERSAETTGSKSAVKSARRIGVASKRLLKTMTSILELSRLEAGEAAVNLSSFVVREVADDALREVAALARSRDNTIEVVDELAGERVRSDRSKLRYMIEGLLDNACRFTERGRVTLRVSRATDDGRAWLRVAVTDDGVGIAEQDLDKLFRPFSQLDGSTTRAHEGSGTTLVVTRLFCRILGGDITVESEPGRGSTFTLRVPAGGAS